MVGRSVDPRFFIVVWAVAGLAVAAFLQTSTPQFKKRAWPYVAIGTPLAFFVVIIAMGKSAGVKDLTSAWIFLPFGALIWFSQRATRVCGNCGRINRPIGLGFTPPEFCSKCGTTLDD